MRTRASRILPATVLVAGLASAALAGPLPAAADGPDPSGLPTLYDLYDLSDLSDDDRASIRERLRHLTVESPNAQDPQARSGGCFRPAVPHLTPGDDGGRMRHGEPLLIEF